MSPLNISSTLSAILEELHSSCINVGPEHFQQHVAKLLQQYLVFDLIYWEQHRIVGSKLEVNALLQDQLNRAALTEAIERLSLWLNFVVVPWCCQALSNDEWPQELNVKSINHLLYTPLIDPFSQLPFGLLLGRQSNAFSEQERFLVQQLTPHLEIALSHCYSMTDSNTIEKPLRQDRRQSNALMNQQQQIFASESRFTQLMELEYPDSKSLPATTKITLSTNEHNHFIGKYITISSYPKNGFWVLWARPKHLVDDLSTHTIELATHFANGLTHKEIGQLMQLSPATVRNHISIIYKKLNVGNKTQLAQLLTEGKRLRARR